MGISARWLSHASTLMVVALTSGCLLEVQTDTSALSSDPTQGSTNPAPGGGGPVVTPNPTGANTLPVGTLRQIVYSTGTVSGWAADADTSKSASPSIYVEFYVDGPQGTGTFVGSQIASQNNTIYPPGPFAFNLSIPNNLRDGKLHNLYVYAIDANTSARVQLDNSPHAFNVGNTAAQSYYTSTVGPALQSRCAGCHAWTYDSAKYVLLDPSKFQGGAATSNTIFDKAIGRNSHGGGNVCGSASGSPCNVLQTWWGMESN